jgi:hypothetical protein
VKSENFTKLPILDKKTRVTLKTHRTNFIVFFLPFFYFFRSSTSYRLIILKICKGFPTINQGLENETKRNGTKRNGKFPETKRNGKKLQNQETKRNKTKSRRKRNVTILFRNRTRIISTIYSKNNLRRCFFLIFYKFFLNKNFACAASLFLH